VKRPTERTHPPMTVSLLPFRHTLFHRINYNFFDISSDDGTATNACFIKHHFKVAKSYVAPKHEQLRLHEINLIQLRWTSKLILRRRAPPFS